MDFDPRTTHYFQAVNNEIPPLHGLLTDHKTIPAGDEEKGPPQRRNLNDISEMSYD